MGTKFKISLLLIAGMFTLMYCTNNRQPERVTADSRYVNLHDTVDYVGMNTCKTCHPGIYKTYMETGMGLSFDHATREKSSATFDTHAIVYDEDLDFYYKPFWKDSVFYIMEFRLNDGDTIHKQIEKISYVIGSGQHTNSHLINKNGYVFQAPITYYTQDGKWDLAPGYEAGESSRFSRIITTECMTCHNHLPDVVQGSENKYEYVPQGIECERCHGPGEAHVNEKMAGIIIDTSQFIDYSIIVPTDLPVELEIDVCQRCHLQGTTVLKDGKTFFDYRPGMHLNDVMNVFLPRYTNSHERFIMASQADRMQMSKCFTVGKVSCTSCHNPHKSVQSTAIDTYNDACKNCHSTASKSICSAPEDARKLSSDNCSGCHMPKSGSIDIPHVRITDHFISKPVTVEQKDEIAKFVGLECLTCDEATPLEMADGYLALFDKFVPEPDMLDSAEKYIDLDGTVGWTNFKSRVHFLFNKMDYSKLAALADAFEMSAINDGWTAYRIGEANLKINNAEKALEYFRKAVEFKPFNLDFQNKLGVAYMTLKDFAAAKNTFEFIVSENPDDPVALNNLGFTHLMHRDIFKAEDFYQKSLALDPDYQLAELNMIGLYVFKDEPSKAKRMTESFLERYPDNEQAKMILNRLQNY